MYVGYSRAKRKRLTAIDRGFLGPGLRLNTAPNQLGVGSGDRRHSASRQPPDRVRSACSFCRVYRRCHRYIHEIILVASGMRWFTTARWYRSLAYWYCCACHALCLFVLFHRDAILFGLFCDVIGLHISGKRSNVRTSSSSSPYQYPSSSSPSSSSSSPPSSSSSSSSSSPPSSSSSSPSSSSSSSPPSSSSSSP